MNDDGRIFIGRGDDSRFLELKRANRHGLVAGATGTGKTVTLRILAEGFSAAGVPVFVPDVKGDLGGLALPGSEAGFLTERAVAVGLPADYPRRGFPTVFWDLEGRAGTPARTTVSEIGPLLLARLLDLSPAQVGILTIVFDLADEDGLLLLDLADLRALLGFVADNAKALRSRYGLISGASVAAIRRKLLALETQGAEAFLGEPALALDDLMRRDDDGRGVIGILAADRLIRTPLLYATFLLWLLAELFETLPEVGDPERPRLVIFFDEAHLLFDDAPDALVDRVVQAARLIRSKGVGLFFVTQSPGDLPDEVLGQLGNRIQHALRAYTPRERRALKAAADGFRANPAFDTAEAIAGLGIGEALVSMLEPDGAPGVVQRTLIRPPESRLDPLDAAERDRLLSARSLQATLQARYATPVDRDSAHEMLARRAAETAQAAARAEASPARTPRPPARRRDGMLEATAKSVLRSVGRQLGRELVRGLLGSILRR